MAKMTSFEREVVELSAKITSILNVFESNKIKVDRMHKDLYENGISGKISEMHELLQKVDAEHGQVRKASIGLWISNHPKVAWALFVLYHVIVASFYVSGWRRPLLQWLGVPTEFIP